MPGRTVTNAAPCYDNSAHPPPPHSCQHAGPKDLDLKFNALVQIIAKGWRSMTSPWMLRVRLLSKPIKGVSLRCDCCCA